MRSVLVYWKIHLLLFYFCVFLLSFASDSSKRKSTLYVDPTNVSAFAPTGFIDFIVYPTFSLLTDMAEKIVIPLVEENPGAPDPCSRHRWHSQHFLPTRRKTVDGGCFLEAKVKKEPPMHVCFCHGVKNCDCKISY